MRIKPSNQANDKAVQTQRFRKDQDQNPFRMHMQNENGSCSASTTGCKPSRLLHSKLSQSKTRSHADKQARLLSVGTNLSKTKFCHDPRFRSSFWLPFRIASPGGTGISNNANSQTGSQRTWQVDLVYDAEAKENVCHRRHTPTVVILVAYE